jgi:putative ABC transport system permease protein
MWLVSLRDLQFRLRRFIIAVAVTALVFGIALAFDGVKHRMENEPQRIVDSFHADQWVVARGAVGPFTTTKVLPDSVATELATRHGVTKADPVVISRAVLAPSGKDVNLIGYVPGGLGAPEISAGRAIRGPGEAVVGAATGASLGDSVSISGRKFEVVGETSDSRYLFGTPTVYLSLHDAQGLTFRGQPLAMGVAVRGDAGSAPAGMSIRSNADGVSDLKRPIKGGIQTISFTDIMLWIIAAGIIGSIIYMTALERVRDFAVFKATGAPTRMIVGGLIVQAIILAVTAAIVSIGLAVLVSKGMPFPIEIGVGSIAQLLGIAIGVGVLASLAGVRRALTTDPAVAFGGA